MILDYDKYKNTDHIAEAYQNAQPFPYVVLNDFFVKSEAEKALKVFPEIKDKGWIHYVHVNENKHGLNKLELIPDVIKNGVLKELNSSRFLELLENITGIKNLLADKTIEGGGIHQSENGGFLNVHADFTVHPHNKNWYRRVNVLVYLNQDWDESYGGNLEFWEKDMSKSVVSIAPLFNRVVIFNTTEDSYHGFPDPISCPENVTRKSIALYYFTEEKSGAFKRKSTNYKARPNDGLKAIPIWMDKKLIAIYTSLKSALGLNDDFVSKFLFYLKRKK